MADTNDFLTKLFQMNNQPPVPLMDPNADNEPKQEDFAPAQEADPISLGKMPQPDLAKRREILDQYKSFRSPAAEQPQDESELESHLNKMDTNNNSRLDQEMASADFDQKAMTGTPEDVSVSSQSSPQAKMLSDFQRLKNAQGNYSDQLSNIAMLGGGNKIAQGFAMGRGANIGDNSEGIKQLQQAAAQPMNNIVEQMKVGGTDMNDPNSDISKFARQQAVAIMQLRNPKFDGSNLEGISAAQLEKLGFKGVAGTTHVPSKEEKFLVNGHPVEYDPYAGYRDAITKKPISADDKIVNAIPRVNPVTGQLEYTMTNDMFKNPGNSPQQIPNGEKSTAKVEEFKPNVAQREALEKNGKEFESGVQNHITRLQDIDALLHELDSNNKLQIPAVSERMAKIAKGTGGVLNAQEEQRFSGSNQIMDRMQQYLQTMGEGTFTPENKKQFRELAENYIDTAKQAIPDVRNRFANRLDMNYQIPQDFSKKYFGGDITTPYIDKLTKNSGLPPVADGMVRFQDSSGKIHDIPEKNLDAAKKRDPKLKVIK